MNHQVQVRFEMGERADGGRTRRHWTKSHRQIQFNLPVSVDLPAGLRENFAMAGPHPILILPFGLLLGAMALAPVIEARWWARHHAKNALGLGAVVAGISLLVLPDTASPVHAAHEYI